MQAGASAPLSEGPMETGKGAPSFKGLAEAVEASPIPRGHSKLASELEQESQV